VIVVGSGPIRIGQGIEFDYASVRAAWAIREMGLDAVVINNNPETVSTDYDACSRLYFEPLDTESVLDVIDHERALTGEPPIVLLTFGGQTAIDLAKDLAYADVPIAGLTAEAIETTEDRERFARLLDELSLEGPPGLLASDTDALHAAIVQLGLPVIVRPSWVIGGRGIAVLRSTADVDEYLATEVGWPLRVDQMIGGTELDVDAISDGSDWCVPGILEQLDPPGVHSGDSLAVLPPQGVTREVQERAAEAAGRIATALGVRGVLNVQMIATRDGGVVVIEANPRASRTVPIVAKATGRDVVAAAVRCALGDSLTQAGLQPGLAKDGPMVAVKAPVDSLWRLPGVAGDLGPEMRSTGEVLGLAPRYEEAAAAALEAVAAHQP
jgi:carbamoyl-phosphate synthase large subunit